SLILPVSLGRSIKKAELSCPWSRAGRHGKGIGFAFLGGRNQEERHDAQTFPLGGRESRARRQSVSAGGLSATEPARLPSCPRDDAFRRSQRTYASRRGMARSLVPPVAAGKSASRRQRHRRRAADAGRQAGPPRPAL